MVEVRCRDGCGAVASNEEAALAQAWSWLPVSKTWRCPACARVLRELWRTLPTEVPPTSV